MTEFYTISMPIEVNVSFRVQFCEERVSFEHEVDISEVVVLYLGVGVED